MSRDQCSLVTPGKGLGGTDANPLAAGRVLCIGSCRRAEWQSPVWAAHVPPLPSVLILKVRCMAEVSAYLWVTAGSPASPSLQPQPGPSPSPIPSAADRLQALFTVDGPGVEQALRIVTSSSGLSFPFSHPEDKQAC